MIDRAKGIGCTASRSRKGVRKYRVSMQITTHTTKVSYDHAKYRIIMDEGSVFLLHDPTAQGIGKCLRIPRNQTLVQTNPRETRERGPYRIAE